MQNLLCHLTVAKLTVQSSIASYYFMSVTDLLTYRATTRGPIGPKKNVMNTSHSLKYRPYLKDFYLKDKAATLR